jgi:hypothetical protein
VLKVELAYLEHHAQLAAHRALRLEKRAAAVIECADGESG